MNRPDVFDYKDFRTYLADMYTFRRSSDKSFSKARICRELGLENSRSYFQDILNGKFLSPYKLPLLMEIFELSRDEQKYFRVLVNYNQTFDAPDEREIYFEQLLSLKQLTGHEIDPRQFEYYLKWYNPVIRATLDIVDIREDETPDLRRWIIPDIGLQEIRESITLLTDLELIYTNPEGYLKPSDKIIRTPKACRDEAILQFQNNALAQARQVLNTPTRAGMEMKTMTKMLSLSRPAMEQVYRAVKRFSNEVNTIVSDDENSPDRVYKMILTLFPYARKDADL
ncbi:MAG: TIGR02147 family protein [Fibrobacterota bacterium]